MKKKTLTIIAAIFVVALTVSSVNAQETNLGYSWEEELMLAEADSTAAEWNGPTGTDNGHTAGILPGTERQPPPFCVMAGYYTGTSELNPDKRHLWEPCLDQTVETLHKNNYVAFGFGETSMIDMDKCYAGENSSFLTSVKRYNKNKEAYPNARFVEGNDLCNRELGWARSGGGEKAVLKRAHEKGYDTPLNRYPIDETRFVPLKYAAWANREGDGEFDSQTTVIFMISRERIGGETGPVIGACPTCPEPEFDYELPPCSAAFTEKVPGGYQISIVTWPCGETDTPTTPRDDNPCWKKYLWTPLPGAAIGWGISEMSMDGGSGAGDAGDGGDMNACGENGLGCIIGGAALTYVGSVGLCEAKRAYERKHR